MTDVEARSGPAAFGPEADWRLLSENSKKAGILATDAADLSVNTEHHASQSLREAGSATRTT
jgi:hypothetical protein